MAIVKHFFSNSKAGVGHWNNELIAAYDAGGKKVLDVGCGKRKIRGAIGVDLDKNSDADVIADVAKGIDFPDNYFDEIFCLNFLEHTFQFDKILTELHRVLKPSGILHVEVPYYNSYNFGQTPFHFIMFCETTFSDWYARKGTFSRYTKAKFRILEQELYFTKPAWLIPGKLRIKAAHYIGNLCYQIYWKLQKD